MVESLSVTDAIVSSWKKIENKINTPVFGPFSMSSLYGQAQAAKHLNFAKELQIAENWIECSSLPKDRSHLLDPLVVLKVAANIEENTTKSLLICQV